MTGKRIGYSGFHLQFLGEGNPGGWWRSIFYLLVAGLLVACGASNPPRESTHQLQASVEGTHSEVMSKAAGKEGSPPAPGALEQFSTGDSYQIGPFDLLKIEVFQVPELSQTVRVDSLGYVSLPLIGSVLVKGLTSQQLGVYLAQLWGKKYLQTPQVSVFIEEYISQRVTVAGAVEEPGIYPLKGRMTLLQAIAVAKGLTHVADEEEVKVLRSTGDDTRRAFYYNIEAIQEGTMPDPKLHSDDIVVVEKSGIKVFFKEFSSYVRIFVNPIRFLY